MDIKYKKEFVKRIYRDVFGHEGREFGTPVHGHYGVSEHNKGVQWNIVIDTNLEETWVSINLEGLKYIDWIIARFIEKELDDLLILEVSKKIQYNNIPVYIYFRRDAWQVKARPRIKEQIIGNEITPITNLNEQKWKGILLEAYQCLNNRTHRGRAKQVVTLESNGVEKQMEVSPHLIIKAPAWGLQLPSYKESVEIIKNRINLLMPFYEYVNLKVVR